MLFSIGHSTLPAEKFVALLNAHAIAVLVDVRSKPFSRFNPQFNRSILAATVEAAGVEYQWRGEFLGGLGGTSTDSREFITAMDELIALATDRNVAMMCSEGDPAHCHRTSKLGAWLAQQRAITVSHIMQTGVLTQAQAELGRRKSSKLGGPKQGQLLQ
jgi:uncharacterized protein (DUF488 family)